MSVPEATCLACPFALSCLWLVFSWDPCPPRSTGFSKTHSHSHTHLTLTHTPFSSFPFSLLALPCRRLRIHPAALVSISSLQPTRSSSFYKTVESGKDGQSVFTSWWNCQLNTGACLRPATCLMLPLDGEDDRVYLFCKRMFRYSLFFVSKHVASTRFCENHLPSLLPSARPLWLGGAHSQPPITPCPSL